MSDLTEGFAAAFRLLFGFDADLWESFSCAGGDLARCPVLLIGLPRRRAGGIPVRGPKRHRLVNA